MERGKLGGEFNGQIVELASKKINKRGENPLEVRVARQTNDVLLRQKGETPVGWWFFLAKMTLYRQARSVIVIS